MSPLVRKSAPPRKAPPKKSPVKKTAGRKAPPKKSPPRRKAPTNSQLAAKELYPKEKVPYRSLPPAQTRHGGGLTGGHHVTMQAWGLQLSLKALLGPDGGKLTQAYGAWEEVPIPRGDPFIMWKGRTLYGMTLDLIFDGWGLRPRSVEPQLKVLESLATRIPGTLQPTNVRIYGAVPKPGLSWVITGVDYDDGEIRDPRSGQRYRQEVHLHLLEYRAETAVAQLPRAAATPKPPQKYKVKKGDDLKKIAAKLLGKSSKWQLIEKANKGLRGFKIPAKFIGKTLIVPPRT